MGAYFSQEALMSELIVIGYDDPTVADDAYNAVPAASVQSCDKRRTRIPDGRGGWVWGVKTICR